MVVSYFFAECVSVNRLKTLFHHHQQTPDDVDRWVDAFLAGGDASEVSCREGSQSLSRLVLVVCRCATPKVWEGAAPRLAAGLSWGKNVSLEIVVTPPGSGRPALFCSVPVLTGG